MNLNNSQSLAVGHMNGPMLVLAGPGSGKTLVITERVFRLVTERGVDPAHILVITFTKAAAAEMRERFLRRIGGGRCPVTFGTFHAVFFQILKHAYGFHSGNIAREEQRFALMRDIILENHLEYEDENELIGELLGEIGTVKNTGIPLTHYYPKSCAKEIFEQIYQAYASKMKEQRLIDFDDMLVYCYELFAKRKDILLAWQQKFRYILVDEFQDINKIQFDIIRMLAQPEDNLFAVGDDDQSIYRFRGAKPELMLGFWECYPRAGRVLLDVNYRSLAPIVAASQNLISYNSQRFEKEIRSCGFPHGRKSLVSFHLWDSQREEGEAVIGQIRRECEAGRGYKDIAVLFRTNTQPRLFMSQLMAYNIPFRTRDNVPNLYEHWIAKDIFAYISLAQGNRTRKEMLKVMNRPNRYITRDSLPKSQVAFEAWAGYFYQKGQHWVAERIEQLEADLRVISRITPFAAINYIRAGIGYEGYLKEYAGYRRINADDLIEVLDELQDGSKGYKTYEAWFAHIEDYTRKLQEQKEQQKRQENCVSLATLHSAKGLEYPVVHILDVDEGVTPYKKAVLEEDIQEERRMFYVGVTRAKEELHIHSVRKYNGKEACCSRFVEEMKKPLRQA